MGLTHHSDRGAQHGCREQPLREYQNREFFRTLKIEEVYLKDYRDFEEAQRNIGRFIEEV